MTKKIWQGEGEDVRGNSQAHVHLEGIVDAPLESSQGTNHDNTQRESTGEESSPAVTSLISLHIYALYKSRDCSSTAMTRSWGHKRWEECNNRGLCSTLTSSDPDEPVVYCISLR